MDKLALFFSNAEENCVSFIKRKRVRSHDVARVQVLDTFAPVTSINYETRHGAVALLKQPPAAVRKRVVFSAMSRRIAWTVGCALSKTQRFRCFHKDQATRMTSVSNPFFFSLGTLSPPRRHHSARVSSAPGARSCSPTFRKARYQTSRATTHWSSMCCMLSWC